MREAHETREMREMRKRRAHTGGAFVRAPTASHVFQCMIGRAKERNTNKRKGGITRKVERCVGGKMFSSGEARAGAARTISEAQNFASVLSLIAKIKIVL